MDRLRPRQRQVFTGFTKAEIEKLEKSLNESGEQALNREYCQNFARSFSRSSGRAGKPIVKWTEVHSWFQSRLQDSAKASENKSEPPEACPSNKEHEISGMLKEAKIPDLSDLEFEAKSSKDGAWYDVDLFLAHRFLSTGEAEVRVRFVGFGAEEDEWVNIKKAVRERSIPLEHSECHKVKVGDLVLCFQERRDQAIYYDAHVLEVQRRMHDIRGCRCLFLVRYNHDNSEERVRLKRLCSRPT
ncbi:protein SAWADEE HOMEODOMAIN HOMOLOG 1 isoform X2 [Ziziphus jujuba]|uniref:Protein SAWADEE HOMEODOMAIN HOMOLOG 1 isoform X2 n=1 Tax=Ziziphus jujuba TaxID=326968 RepID=A0A6P4A9L6_ZIZJJ|nr:protein SAWADEE HOMEODOMAIN HOMOLOG 1 isoform X2 [Ziziphus jujuba]